VLYLPVDFYPLNVVFPVVLGDQLTVFVHELFLQLSDVVGVC
jgi:hypothetical protein